MDRMEEDRDKALADVAFRVDVIRVLDERFAHHQERLAETLDRLREWKAAVGVRPGDTTTTARYVSTVLGRLTEFLGVEQPLPDAVAVIVERCAEAERDLHEARGTVLKVGREMIEARSAALEALDRNWESTSTADLVRELCAARIDLPAMLAAFHASFGQAFGDGGSGNAKRALLHESEQRELIEALESGDRVAIAHELADNVYAEYGTAHSLGIDLNAVLVEVHRANMGKAGPDGRMRLDANGKVVKPTNFVPPDVAAIVRTGGT